jgi:DNA-directed RNA polymerase subunit M/transcription elongation factor TFIIS
MKESSVPPTAPERAAGLTCPQCGHRRSHVLYTRANGGRLSRRRICLACGARFTTWEHIVGCTKVSAPPHPDGVTSA